MSLTSLLFAINTSDTVAALGAQLTAPSGLTIKRLGTSDSDRLSWTNNDDNALNVEVWKDGSLHDTLPPDQDHYDVDRSSSSWKVRAVSGVAADSAFSDTVTGPATTTFEF